jgi:nucleoid-associated protein YgaU
MLPAMESPEPALPSPASAVIVDLPAKRVGSATDEARQGVHACPFLIAESGDWRLATPTREHRCAALAPLASLTLEKQARLCLTSAHETCATYGAALAARQARTGGAITLERAGRWSIALTTPLIEDAGGVRSRVGGILADRRRWPAVPVVILVATLFALAISGVRNDRPATAVASSTVAGFGASAAPLTSPTTVPAITPVPATASPPPASTSTPTPIPTSRPVATPAPTPAYRATYRVQSGDTLSGIAAKFHTTVGAIERLNGITDPTRLRIGQVLKIP